MKCGVLNYGYLIFVYRAEDISQIDIVHFADGGEIQFELIPRWVSRLRKRELSGVLLVGWVLDRSSFVSLFKVSKTLKNRQNLTVFKCLLD